MLSAVAGKPRVNVLLPQFSGLRFFVMIVIEMNVNISNELIFLMFIKV